MKNKILKSLIGALYEDGGSLYFIAGQGPSLKYPKMYKEGVYYIYNTQDIGGYRYELSVNELEAWIENGSVTIL